MRHETQPTVVELLKDLGLDEYEARVFVDRNELLLSSAADCDGERVETAVRSTEFGNGLLAMMRRLLDASLAE